MPTQTVTLIPFLTVMALYEAFLWSWSNGIIYPSLSLEMMRIVLNESKITLQYDEKGMSQILLGELAIPTDFYGRMLVNYRGPQNSYRYISAADIYFKRIDTLHVEGKIALLERLRLAYLIYVVRHLIACMQGLEVHANALDNIQIMSLSLNPFGLLG